MHISKKVNVLGVRYKIRLQTSDEDEDLKGCDGYCREYQKLIAVRDYRREDVIGCASRKEAEKCIKHSLRHEIVHAFLFESGLGWDSDAAEHWAVHEELVDWIARMHPRIQKAYKEAGCA